MKRIGMMFLLGGALHSSATQTPEAIPPDIETLRAVKSGSNIQLSCTDGVGPAFSIARNALPTFKDAPSLVLATASACAYTDAGAAGTPASHFYYIADSQHPPRIFAVSAKTTKPGDSVTIQGIALTGAEVISPDGTPLSISASSALSITYTALFTTVTSGPVLILTPWGGDFTDFTNFISFSPGVANEIFDIAFYQDASLGTKRVMFGSREGTTNKIYTLTPGNLNVATFVTTANYPMGLNVGLITGGYHLFFGRGQNTTSTGSKVYKLDFLSGAPAQTDFKSTSFGGDAFTIRALSFYPPEETQAGERMLYAFDPTAAQQRIREVPEGSPLRNWTNSISSWSANVTNRNYAGGLAIRHDALYPGPAQTLYVTKGTAGGQILSQLEFRKFVSTTTSQLLWTSPFVAGKFSITNGAQLALEPFRDELVFVADRGNPGQSIPSLIHKVNASKCGQTVLATPIDCNADPTKAFVSSFAYEGALNGMRGVAIETGQDMGTPVRPYSKFLHVVSQVPTTTYPAGGYGVSRVRALREIPIKVFVGRNADSESAPYTGGGANVRASQDTLKQWIDRNIVQGNRTLYGVGIQIKFDRASSADFVTDVQDDDLPDFAYRIAANNGQCPAELAAMMSRVAVDPKKLNVFIVHGIRLQNAALTPIQYQPAYAQYIHYAAPCGGLNELILVNYVSSHPGYVNLPPAVDLTFSHEIFHKFTISLPAATLQSAGYSIAADETYGHRLAPCNDLLMCTGNHPAKRKLLTDGIDNQHRDDDLANTYGSNTPNDGNFGMSLVLPDNGVLP